MAKRIGIFSGSFKPPHRGHLGLVLDAIRKDRLTHLVIIISQKGRYLEEIVQYPEEFSKEELSSRFGLPLSTKGSLLKEISAIKRTQAQTFPSITADQSAAIWRAYLENAKVAIPYDIRISHAFSPMINSDRYLQSAIRKDAAEKDQYFLYKSMKDEKNTRFDFITSATGIGAKAKNRIHIKVTKEIGGLNARDFRKAILAKKSITNFLPKGMSSKKFYTYLT